MFVTKNNFKLKNKEMKEDHKIPILSEKLNNSKLSK